MNGKYINVNQCLGCGVMVKDDGSLVTPWGTSSPGQRQHIACYAVNGDFIFSDRVTFHDVVCDDCIRIVSRASERAPVCLSSTPKVKVQPEENKNEQNPQHVTVDNKPVVPGAKDKRVQRRGGRSGTSFLARLAECWREDRKQKGDNQDD